MRPSEAGGHTALRITGGILVAFVALIVSFAAAVLIAAGLNFGYEFHPQYLGVALPVAGVAVGLVTGALALARLGSARARIVSGVVTVGVCFAAVVAMVEYGGVGQAETERRNAPLLDEIEPCPGARAGLIETSPSRPNTDTFAMGYLNQQDGWETVRVDRVPAGTSGTEAAVHYARQMRGHRWSVRAFPDGYGRELLGRRGRALLDVYVERNGSKVTLWADFEGNRMCKSSTEAGCW